MISNRKRPTHIRVKKDSPYYRMSYRGYISRSRLNMAMHLDRCLGSDEYIYFLDGNSFNEDISNLQLVSHKELTKLNLIRRIENKIASWTYNIDEDRIDRWKAEKKILESQLEQIRFDRPPCRCRKCMRSIDSRQAEYRMLPPKPKVKFIKSGSKLRYLHVEPAPGTMSGYKILGVFPYPQNRDNNLG